MLSKTLKFFDLFPPKKKKSLEGEVLGLADPANFPFGHFQALGTSGALALLPTPKSTPPGGSKMPHSASPGGVNFKKKPGGGGAEMYGKLGGGRTPLPTEREGRLRHKSRWGGRTPPPGLGGPHLNSGVVWVTDSCAEKF